MVIRVQLTIKHIRGDTFQIETNVDSDVLGLKVQIWESKSIPIESQRLVFSGKELQDNVKLTEIGVSDNSVIFLVESSAEVPQQPQSQVVLPVTVEMPQTTTGYPCEYPKSTTNNYVPIENNLNVCEERMQSVIDLGRWIRLYCIFGMVLSGISSLNCFYSLIPFLMYTLGYIGTRKLNRCLLVFPLILTLFTGLSFFGYGAYFLVSSYYGFGFLLLFIGVTHLIISSCICKLMCRISKLNCQEWWQTRVRIQSRSCCC